MPQSNTKSISCIVPCLATYLHRNWKGMLLIAFKLTVTILLICFTLKRVSLETLVVALRQGNPGKVVLAVLTYTVLVMVLETARFWWISRALNLPLLNYGAWFRLYGESRPFLYLLPASLGAEGVMWARLRQFGWPHRACASLVLQVRLLGVGCWALILALDSSSRLLTQLHAIPRWAKHPMIWLGLALLSACAAWVIGGWEGRGIRVLGRIAILFGHTLLALASAGASVVAASLAATAVGVEIPIQQLAGMLALVNFGMVLPVSIGGVGLQEALLLSLGLMLGGSQASLLALGVVLHLQRMALALAGGMFWLKRLQLGKSDVLSAQGQPGEAGV